MWGLFGIGRVTEGLLEWFVGLFVKDPITAYGDDLETDVQMPEAALKLRMRVSDLGPFLAELESVLPGLDVHESGRVLERANLLRKGRTALIPVQITEPGGSPEELQIRLGKPVLGEVLLVFLASEEVIERIKPFVPREATS